MKNKMVIALSLGTIVSQSAYGMQYVWGALNIANYPIRKTVDFVSNTANFSNTNDFSSKITNRFEEEYDTDDIVSKNPNTVNNTNKDQKNILLLSQNNQSLSNNDKTLAVDVLKKIYLNKPMHELIKNEIEGIDSHALTDFEILIQKNTPIQDIESEKLFSIARRYSTAIDLLLNNEKNKSKMYYNEMDNRITVKKIKFLEEFQTIKFYIPDSSSKKDDTIEKQNSDNIENNINQTQINTSDNEIKQRSVNEILSKMPHSDYCGWKDYDKDYDYDRSNADVLEKNREKIKWHIDLYNAGENINLSLLLQQIDTIKKMYPDEKESIKPLNILIKEIKQLQKEQKIEYY